MNNHDEYVAIIMSGGASSRLYPSNIVNKHLLNIFDKPLIYYPLSLSIESNIRNIIFVSDSFTNKILKKRFDKGNHLGLNIEYINQKNPNGIAECFLLCEKKILNKKVLLILGDNILFHNNLSNVMKKFITTSYGCSVMTYAVSNPKSFGILKYKNNYIFSIEEKPKYPQNNRAVIGIYYFDNKVVDFAKTIKKSKRGELEITSIIKKYIKQKDINVINLNKKYKWFDTGESKKLLEASNFINKYQTRNNSFASIEKIAFKNRFINKQEIKKIIKLMPSSNYKKNLLLELGL